MQQVEPSLFERAFLRVTRGASDETLIAVIETVMRTRWALDPRTYIRSMRMFSQTDGAARFDGGRYCIFVSMFKRRLPGFTRIALEALKRANVNTVVVNIGRVSPAIKAELGELCHTFIERDNIGRDFGAYKDAFMFVEKLQPERLLFLNDSLYFLENGIDAFIERLFTSKADITGATETHEHHFHIQSFAVSVSKAVINNPAFSRYWREYMPISTRRWSIHAGEVGLSYVLTKKIGGSVDIIYSSERLYDRLGDGSNEEIYKASEIMPRDFRKESAPALFKTIGDAVSSTYVNLMRVHKMSSAATVIADSQDPSFGAVLQSSNENQLGSIDYYRRSSLGMLSNYIGLRNGMHVGGLPFVKYLDMPMFKRDIVYRELYTIPEVSDFLNNLDMSDASRAEIVADLRAKGYPYWLKGLKRFMYVHGMA